MVTNQVVKWTASGLVLRTGLHRPSYWTSMSRLSMAAVTLRLHSFPYVTSSVPQTGPVLVTSHKISTRWPSALSATGVSSSRDKGLFQAGKRYGRIHSTF